MSSHQHSRLSPLSLIGIKRGATVVAVTFFAVVGTGHDARTLIGVSPPPSPQNPCPDQATLGNTDLIPKVLVGSCQLQSSGYVLRASTLTVHGRAVAEGHCTKSIPSGNPPKCVPWYNFDRGTNSISVKTNTPDNPPPASPYSLGPIYSKPTNQHYQVLDSEDLVHSFGPRQADVLLFGQHWIYEEAPIFITLCNLNPNTTGQRTFTYFGMNCLPQWRIVPDNLIRHLATGVIQISVVSELVEAATAAAKAWTTALQSQGINIELKVENCSAINDHCIRVQAGLPPEKPNACSSVHNAAYDSSGVITTSPVITVRSPTSWTPEVRQFLLAHEIGHLLGLDENGCSRPNSVMAVPPQGTECVLDSGQATLPTGDDVLPVAKTVYGNGSRSVCPVQ